jgi:hypothetical protein
VHDDDDDDDDDEVKIMFNFFVAFRNKNKIGPDDYVLHHIKFIIC